MSNIFQKNKKGFGNVAPSKIEILINIYTSSIFKKYSYRKKYSYNYNKMTNHWLVHVGDGINFKKTSSKGLWGMRTKNSHVVHFIRKANTGDQIWFVSKGKQIIATATYTSFNKRVIGDLITMETNEERGWNGNENWDIDIHYTDLYNLENIPGKNDFKLKFVNQTMPRMFNLEKEDPNLPELKQQICRFMMPVENM
jgi:hypothetical protein